MNKKINEQEYFLSLIKKNFKTNEFSITEAKNIFLIKYRINEKDFSNYWQQVFNPDGKNNYINRGTKNKENFMLNHRALLCLRKQINIEKIACITLSVINLVTAITTLIQTVILMLSL